VILVVAAVSSYFTPIKRTSKQTIPIITTETPAPHFPEPPSPTAPPTTLPSTTTTPPTTPPPATSPHTITPPTTLPPEPTPYYPLPTPPTPSVQVDYHYFSASRDKIDKNNQFVVGDEVYFLFGITTSRDIEINIKMIDPAGVPKSSLFTYSVNMTDPFTRIQANRIGTYKLNFYINGELEFSDEFNVVG
jgi:hypothetical protein